MVTGRRAFAGDDVSDTLASVLRAEVAWTGVPPSLVRLLKKCLERDPRNRLHDIGDAWDLIDAAPIGAERVSSRGSWIGWAIAAILATATGALAWLHFSETASTPEIVRFQIQPPPKNAFDIYLALSPDGRHLAFTARDDGGTVHLWVRSLNALEARLLPGTEGAWSPFWSPDSRQIAFAVERTLKKVDLAGGPPQTLGESATTVGMGAWSADGVIVFGTRGQGPLYRIPAAGGVATPLTVVDPARADGAQSFPQFLPDGRRFLYYRQSTKPEHQGLYAGSLDVPAEQQSTTRLLATSLGTFAIASAPAGERLLFLRDGTLFEQPFDVESLQVQGEPTPLVEDVGGTGQFGYFSVSANGVLVYRTGAASATNTQQLAWLDRKGAVVDAIGEVRPYSTQGGSMAIAPDGNRAVIVVAPTLIPDLWFVDFAREVSTRFTHQTGGAGAPIWSPDGSRIAFRLSRSGVVDTYVKDVNGTADETALMTAPGAETPTDWSRDGRFLLFQTANPKTAVDIWIASPGRETAPVPLLSTAFNEGFARFSPDGRWIAYASNESGRSEVYLRPFSVDGSGKPSVGPKWLVSNAGVVPSGGPRWRGDGRELYFRQPDGAMMAVDVMFGSGKVSTSLPRQLFDLSAAVNNWDVASNGQRFLVLLPANPQTSDPISVVLNWSQGLPR
jgi:Tol biopolymer transport system component